MFSCHRTGQSGLEGSESSLVFEMTRIITAVNDARIGRLLLAHHAALASAGGAARSAWGDVARALVLPIDRDV